MIDISGLPNVDPATANLINGVLVDVTTPGDGTGTPVRKDWQSDLYYALIAIMNDAGIAADNSAEGATGSQFKDAILRIARKQVGAQSYSNLLIKRNAGTPNSKVDVTFDKMWIEGIEKLSGSYTIDITASGALGLDTGAESADAWYYIWMIAKTDGTVSALFSASATSPTLPAGYTLKRIIGAVRNTSSNFVDFYQKNTSYSTTNKTLISGGSSLVIAAVDISSHCPVAITKYISGHAYVPGTGAGYIMPEGTGLGHFMAGLNGSYKHYNLPVYGNNIYYNVDGAANLNLYMTEIEITI